MGDAKFESMVRRESRKNILKENSKVEEEQEDEAAREDEIFLLESLQDEAANSKVLSGRFTTCMTFKSGEVDDPDQVDGRDRGVGAGGEDGGGGGRRDGAHGDQGTKAGP